MRPFQTTQSIVWKAESPRTHPSAHPYKAPPVRIPSSHHTGPWETAPIVAKTEMTAASWYCARERALAFPVPVPVARVMPVPNGRGLPIEAP